MKKQKIVTYKTITYHYPKQKVEIDYRGNGKFSIWSIDDTGQRDHEPLYEIYDPLVKKYSNYSDIFANKWVTNNR
jgi:hypothetical protein